MIDIEKDNARIKRVAMKLAKQLIASNEKRTVKGQTLEIILDSYGYEYEIPVMVVTSWGYDYEPIMIPRSRKQLTAGRITAQCGPDCAVNQIALNYYLAIGREVDRLSMKDK